jgi:hypothetical protein
MADIFPVADTELGRLALIPCGESPRWRVYS